MNAKILLTLLEDDFSDDNVATAIAWLKTKNPSNKSANKILHKIFPHPLIEEELEWLTTWAKEADWEFFAGHIYNLKSAVLFDWIIQLLNAHPDNSDTGRVWANLILNFRNKEIEQGAEKWLTNERLNDNNADLVVTALLELNPTQERVQLAKQIYKHSKDVFLLCALIKHTKDWEARHIGEALLEGKEEHWCKQFIAAALTNCDFESHKVSIGKFLADPNSFDGAYRYVQDIFMEQPDSLFVLDWIADNYESKLAKQLLTKPLMIEPADQNGDVLWNWYKTGEENEIRFEICMRSFDNAWCPLPPEAAQYVSSWIEANKKSKLKKYAINALQRVRKSFSTPDETECSKRSALMSHILKTTDFDNDYVEEAQEQIMKSLNVSNQVHLTVQRFKSTNNSEDLEPIRVLFQRSSLPFQRYILCELLPLGLQEFSDLAIETLKVRRLLRKFFPDYRDIGSIIIELLQIDPMNEEVLVIAEDWLKIKPEEIDMVVYEDVNKLVTAAKQQ